MSPAPSRLLGRSAVILVLLVVAVAVRAVVSAGIGQNPVPIPQVLGSLLEGLKEPVESTEIRLPILTAAFAQTGRQAIERDH